MNVRILTLDELGPEHDLGVLVLRNLAHGDLAGIAHASRWRKEFQRLAPYGGLYAVEGDNVLSMVEVHRLHYTAPSGEFPVGGLAYVSTDPKARRQGLAHRLIQEILVRERADGMDWVLLWTGRSMVAHALYCKLGFEDVLSPPRAIRFVPSEAATTEGVRLRVMSDSEAERLGALRERMARGRVGFVRRAPDHIARMERIGLLDRSCVLVLERSGAPVGYVILHKNMDGYVTWEMVAPESADRRALLDAIEATAAGHPVQYGFMPVELWREELERRGYRIITDNYGTLMARSLRHELSAAEMQSALGTTSQRFISQELDGF